MSATDNPPNQTTKLPRPGTAWLHHNGNRYVVLHVANEVYPATARYPLTIVYQGSNGKVWARRADDWHRSMTAVEGAQPNPLCQVDRSEVNIGDCSPLPGQFIRCNARACPGPINTLTGQVCGRTGAPL